MIVTTLDEMSKVIRDRRYLSLSTVIQEVIDGICNRLPGRYRYYVTQLNEDTDGNFIITDVGSPTGHGYNIQVVISLPNPDILSLDWIFISEDLRDKGFATAVMRYLLDICFKRRKVFVVTRAVTETCRILDRLCDGLETVKLIDEGSDDHHVTYIVQAGGSLVAHVSYVQETIAYSGQDMQILR